MLAKLLQTLLDAVLPFSCALCGGHAQAAVCSACAHQYLAVRARCACCANPLGQGDAGRRCGACLAAPPGFDATVTACDYAAPLDALVLQLKFGAQLALAPWMAARLHEALLGSGQPLPDLVCPVPLGRQRLVERGYNQALEVARPLARRLARPVLPQLLERVRDTAPQAGTEPRARAVNVRGAFAVPDVALVAGRHVGVVDDVMTSGHTLAQAAAALKRAGAARVTNIVFARTPPHGACAN